MNMKREGVMATGGAGFIGCTLVGRLAEGGCDVAVNHKRNAACDFINSENGFICELSEENIAEKIFIGFDERKEDMRRRCIENAKRYDWGRIVDLVELFYGD